MNKSRFALVLLIVAALTGLGFSAAGSAGNASTKEECCSPCSSCTSCCRN